MYVVHHHELFCTHDYIDYIAVPCTEGFTQNNNENNNLLFSADSPYHDVSGLPDPYMDQMEQEDSKPPPQHMSLSYDESLESGYSTPNSRNRRVIREIIV